MEEFTFPCISPEKCNAGKKPPFSPHFVATPPPWFGAGGGVVDAVAVAYDHQRSLSAVEKGNGGEEDAGRGGWHYCYYDGGGHSSARFAGEETKTMDMLWEDFNEELSRAAAAAPCPLSKEWTKEAWLVGDGTPEMRRHAAAAATASSGSVVRRRRLSLLLMLKLLRKLFLVHKSNAASRKAPPI